ncbi:MAG: LLM class F420-dependent oxidoreductase, partial [Phycisphaerae bacterium]|nr:LLM class F420-dependent oxidoreductase [Phycisphaerae bacterium]NIX28714.1 LLM class F420-dependent oxidoreductase [Phycisphaerae bacterium]
MKYGAPFIGSFATCDPIAIRDYVQAVEGMGFD